MTISLQSGIYQLGDILQTYGFVDVILPFLLIFTIIFAVLQKSNIIGEGNKNFNVIVALVLSLLTVIPHITGGYPSGYDPIYIMNQALPNISVVIVAIIMTMIIIGLVGGGVGESFITLVSGVALASVIYFFGAAANLWDSSFFDQWINDSTIELVIVILIFGFIVRYITKEDEDEDDKEKMSKTISDWFKGLAKTETK